MILRPLLASVSAVSAALFVTACRCGSKSEAPAKPSAAAPSASQSLAAPDPSPRRTLAERQTPKLETLMTGRAQLLQALETARTLTTAKKHGDALAVLTKARPLDPLGAVLAAAASNAATDSMSAPPATAPLPRETAPPPAVSWARLATDAASWPSITVGGMSQWQRERAAELASTGAAEIGAFDGAQAACNALEERLRAEPAPPAGFGSVSGASCEIEYELDMGAANLQKATAFRVTSEDKTLVRAWVGLSAGSKVKVFGPVNVAFSPPGTDLTNDFIVDLQKVDVLPGGAPEVIVKMDERRTLPDIAMNELLELEQSRVLLLTLDRGKLEGSREFVLSLSQRRKPIDPKDKRLPAGWKTTPKYWLDVSYSRTVAWTGANEITLKKGSSNLATGPFDVPASERIGLFP